MDSVAEAQIDRPAGIGLESVQLVERLGFREQARGILQVQKIRSLKHSAWLTVALGFCELYAKYNRNE
ncbi:hypothetical protein GCM10022278_02460 [Allohahella marinimesophila]|uniref:Uncharacterized protein n=1 Tax=Allohahella marinimesophila TaxID=1054972 RepID=A0ABP7NGP8_9GAMM